MSLLSLAAWALVAGQGGPTSGPFVPEAAYARPRNRVASDKAIKIYFLRTSFENDADPTVSRHTEEAIQGVGRDLDKYFQIQSYGLMRVDKFEVSPVIKLKDSKLYELTDANGKETPTQGRRNLIRDAISTANTQLSRTLAKEFDFICVLVNESPTKGRLQKANTAAYATGPQNSIFFARAPRWTVFSHEIGHNFGFPHAWSVSPKAGDQVPPKPDDRTFREYGDPGSPMGRGMNSYSIIEKYRMGWIGSSPSDARYIQRLAPGNLRFMAYDQANAIGLVGGYLEGDFGIASKELVGRNDDGDKLAEMQIAENPGPSRLWLSVISRGNYAQGAMPDLDKPILVAHLSSLTPNATGPSRATMTVSLDLKPGGKARTRERMEDRGLGVGESSSITLKDGRVLRIRFVGFDPVSKMASVEAQFAGSRP
jgi:hypothetical protein